MDIIIQFGRTMKKLMAIILFISPGLVFAQQETNESLKKTIPSTLVVSCSYEASGQFVANTQVYGFYKGKRYVFKKEYIQNEFNPSEITMDSLFILDYLYTLKSEKIIWYDSAGRKSELDLGSLKATVPVNGGNLNGICTIIQASKKENIATPTYKTVNDLPDGKIIINSLPDNFIPKVCKEISSISQFAFSYPINTINFGSNYYAFKKINENGGGSYMGVKMDGAGTCNAILKFSGIFNNNSYSANLICPVRELKKNDKKISISSLDDDRCKSF